MAPSNLHGLNLVYAHETHAHPHHPGSNAYLSDADLLSAAADFPPDLAAQLDLWTNLAFQPEDSTGARPSAHRGSGSAEKGSPSDEYDDEEELTGARRAGPARPDGHENVVTGTAVGADGQPTNSPASSHASPPAGTPTLALSPAAAAAAASANFDLGSFLATIGVPQLQFDAHRAAPGAASALGAGATPAYPGAPSLSSLLSLYSTQASAAPAPARAEPAAADTARAAKKPRGRKASSAADPTPAPRAPSTARSVSVLPDGGDDGDDKDGSPTAGGGTEDKRRRNTAASARFRAKKKEREAALEQRARTLEGRVGELERECEGLRRENGWLKGLVVGVTGAGAALPGAPAGPLPSAAAGVKRNWEELDGRRD